MVAAVPTAEVLETAVLEVPVAAVVEAMVQLVQQVKQQALPTPVAVAVVLVAPAVVILEWLVALA